MLFNYFIAVFLPVVIRSCCASFEFEVKGNPQHSYFITSFIGTPPQRINLLLDTGSSNLAVASVHKSNVGTNYFVFNESLTFRLTNDNVSLHYVDGDWTGLMGLDVFNLCLENDCTIICNISCMLTMENMFDTDSQYQGIIGMAYSSLAHPNSSVRPFLDVFVAEKNIDDKFSLLLCGPFYSTKEKFTNCGKIHIGYFSEEVFFGDVMYTPIVREWFYEITVVDIKVGQNSAPVICRDFNKKPSFIDSGTTKLEVPLSVYPWIISEIRNHMKTTAQFGYRWINGTVICMENTNLNTSLLPSLTLSLYHSHEHSFDLRISPELYLLPKFNKSCAELAIGTSAYGTIIGSSVLRGFYVIFDRQNKKIGFANPTAFLDMSFASEVSSLQHSSKDLDFCIRVKNSQDFPTAVKVILICLIFISLSVLIPLFSWVWKVIFKGEKIVRKGSDVINLVEEE